MKKGFIQIFIDVITKNYSNFEGRARRREYWGFTLVFILAIFVLVIPMALFVDENNSIISKIMIIVFGLLFLGVIIPYLALTIRRLHDTNRSGWWYLINFVPYIGGFVLLIFTVTEGTTGPNNYGPDPKMLSDEIDEIGNMDEQ